jgi:hypothetical protein
MLSNYVPVSLVYSYKHQMAEIAALRARRPQSSSGESSAVFSYYNVELPSFEDFERRTYRKLCEELSASASSLQPSHVEGNVFSESTAEREAFVIALAAADDAVSATTRGMPPGNLGQWLYLEVGFNAGHSAAIVLSAFPVAHVRSFDLCSHAYVEPNAQNLLALFGSERFSLECGESRHSLPNAAATGSKVLADVVRIDGRGIGPRFFTIKTINYSLLIRVRVIRWSHTQCGVRRHSQRAVPC